MSFEDLSEVSKSDRHMDVHVAGGKEYQETTEGQSKGLLSLKRSVALPPFFFSQPFLALLFCSFLLYSYLFFYLSCISSTPTVCWTSSLTPLIVLLALAVSISSSAFFNTYRLAPLLLQIFLVVNFNCPRYERGQARLGIGTYFLSPCANKHVMNVRRRVMIFLSPIRFSSPHTHTHTLTHSPTHSHSLTHSLYFFLSFSYSHHPFTLSF